MLRHANRWATEVNFFGKISEALPQKYAVVAHPLLSN
jgi:hypothetical protein